MEHIARGSRERLSLLGTFRTEEAALVGSSRSGERITLGALDDRAVEETAMEMLLPPSLPRDVLDAFARAGQGTPRQLGETLRLAADEGWLPPICAGVLVARPASLALLPRSAAEIAARLWWGSSPPRSLLVACAILAVESPEERLQRFADLDDGAFLEASRILVQRRLVETAPPARLRLTYDSVGAEALAPIGGAEPRGLTHSARRSSGALPEPGALSARARHLDLAGSARDAATVYQSAGMEAANRYAAAEGRACYERSLALYLELGDEALVAQALQSLAKLELWSGHIMPARDHLHRALEIAKRVSEEAEARVHLDLDELLHHLGDFPGAEAHCELALCHFRARGPSFDLANALAHKTGALTMQGRWREARAPLAEAMAMPVPGDVQLAALLLFYGCLVADGLGEWEEARRLGLRTLDHFQRSGTPDDVAAILCRLGEAEVLRGEIDDGMQRLEESLAIFREIDYAVNEAGVLVLLGKLHREQGDRDRAREEIDRGLRIAERFDSDGSRIEAWMQQVWLGIEDRDLALAASLGERVLATATKRGMQNLASEAHRALAAIARADLDVESAAEHLSLARALCERTGHRYELALVACEEGRLCVGRGGDARSILAGVEQEQRALGARPGSAIGRAVGALRGAIEGR
ncbi:MAG: tetratricopeptide repeat protein [Acidobacteriota bacterium]